MTSSQNDVFKRRSSDSEGLRLNDENDREHLTGVSLSIHPSLLFSPTLPTSLTHVGLACMERPDLWKV